jgi:hypothetical protein
MKFPKLLRLTGLWQLSYILSLESILKNKLIKNCISIHSEKSALCSKMGASPQVGARGSKKKFNTQIQELTILLILTLFP